MKKTRTRKMLSPEVKLTPVKKFEKWLETMIPPKTYIGTTNPELQNVIGAAQENCAGMQRLTAPFFLFSAISDSEARKFARENKIKAFVRVDGYFIKETMGVLHSQNQQR